MSLRFPTRAHDKTLSERSIEDIMFYFPYLIDNRLRVRDMDERQAVFEDFTRADITFKNDTGVVVVELKKTPINEVALMQLLGYLKKVMVREKGRRIISGILIGSSIKDPIQLHQIINDSSFEVSLKTFGKDVPTTIKFCSNKRCRKAVSTAASSCSFCGSTEFFY